ncbi:MAG: TldD/PmbA family protein [Deltaproteobacteria bacterium]|nr:TldD/PmbA family protein [Deltaproteobacteria bacterium]
MHERRALRIHVEEGRVDAAMGTHQAGVGVRALVDGAWGFAASADLSPAALRDAVRRARAAAAATAPHRAAKVGALGSAGLARGYSVGTPARGPVSAVPVEAKVELCLRTWERVRHAHAHMRGAEVGWLELNDEKWIVTSDGVRAHVVDVKPEFRVSAVAGFEGELQTAQEAVGKTGGMGDLFHAESAEELADKAARTAVDLLRAGYPAAGNRRVVLAPDVVGLLIHEAIGHTVEADFVLSGSAAAGRLGQLVASPLVNLADSGDSPYEPGAGGCVPVDDEGIIARRADIIREGRLVGYLHNRETAEKFGVAPTGNARAYEYDNTPLIRMRNTYLEPGRQTLPELLDGVEDGYLLAGARNGQADANAEFMFAVQEVYPVKKGKLGSLLRGCTMTGNAFDVLRSVDGLGDQFSWRLGSGFCGKGQPAKVDAGGPHLRCQVLLGGRES